MKSYIIKIVVLMMLLFTACVTALPRSPSGVYRPSITTYNYRYVAEFPVNKATKQEILDFVGPPDKSYTSDGIEYLTYITQDNEINKEEYTYFIKNNIAIDVKSVLLRAFGVTVYQNSRIKK